MYALFDFYEVQTRHHDEKVRLTGYYTPIVEVRRKKTGAFTVPLLRRPKRWLGHVPSSEHIFNGALANQGLEIAWCKSKKELHDAQLQGSCIIKFPDGSRKYLGFDGTNKYILSNRHDSLNITDQKPNDLGNAYVFFQERDTLAWGAAGFPLTKGYSIAVDQRVLPLGACLLARLPLRDTTTGVVKYIHRIVMAQDMGASIKTTNHIDLYCGAGEEGRAMVDQIHGFGKLWLLMPKVK